MKTYIYSDEEIEGVTGAYIAPYRFNGIERDATVIYTDKEEIAQAYEESDLEVEVIEIKTKESDLEVFVLEDALENIDALLAGDVKRVAKELDIPYTNKDETVLAIKENQELE